MPCRAFLPVNGEKEAGRSAGTHPQRRRFIGDAEDSVPLYRKALERMDLALTELNRDKSPVIWGKTHSVRGEILLAIGIRTHDRASLLAARDAFIAARDIFREQHCSSGFEGFYRKELGLVEQQLAQAK